MSITVAVFYLLAAITVGSALGVAALFVLLGADFLGAVQLLVYVGGILVLTLFAVMLTHRIADVHVSNRAVGRLPALVMVGVVGGWMVQTVRQAHWVTGDPAAPAPTTYGIGEVLLTHYALPFEIASVVLLAALIGAVVVSRKEVT